MDHGSKCLCHARTPTGSDRWPLGGLFAGALGPAARFRTGDGPPDRCGLSVLRGARASFAHRDLRPARCRQHAEPAGLAGAGGDEQVSGAGRGECRAGSVGGRSGTCETARLGCSRGDRRIAPAFVDDDRAKPEPSWPKCWQSIASGWRLWLPTPACGMGWSSKTWASRPGPRWSICIAN